MGAAIVVTSGKGGTGKTSLTGGVASCLAALRNRVLCIDADVGLRNLDITLGLTDRAVMDFYDVIKGRCTMEQAAVEHPGIKGLFLLTSPVTVRPSDISHDSMIKLVNEAKQKFDYCLIDSPAGTGAGFGLAACGADRAVVVSTADLSSLRDSRYTAMELESAGISVIHMVINRIRHKLIKKSRLSLDDAMDLAGLPLLGVIPEDESVILSANKEVPLVLFSEKGAAAAMLNIARRLEGKRVPLMKL